MKKAISVIFLLFTLFGLGPRGSNPGVVFEVETTYHSASGTRVQSSQIWVHNLLLKMEFLPSEGADAGKVKDEVIYRGDRRQMVVIDHNGKEYFMIDQEMIEGLGRQLNEAKEMMKGMEIPKAALDRLPEAERKKIEEMQKQMYGNAGQGAMPGRSPSEFRKTGERATRQGYPCVRYDVFKDGEKVQELWVTDWDNIKGGQEAFEVFKDLADFYSELMDSFEEMMGVEGGMFGAGQNPIEAFTQVKGFPVVTRNFEDGDLESETVLESVTERDLDPDAFEPPKGYRLRTMGPK